MRWADAHSSSASSLGLAARSAFKLLSLSRATQQGQRQLLPRGASVLDLGCSPGAFLQVASETVGPRGFVFGVDLSPVDVGGLVRKRERWRRGMGEEEEKKTRRRWPSEGGSGGTAAPLSSSYSSPSSRSAPIFTCVADVFDLTPRTLSLLVKEKVEQEQQRQRQQQEQQQQQQQQEARKTKARGNLRLLLPPPPPPFGVVLSDLCHSTLGVRSADAARSLELARAATALALGGAGGGGGGGGSEEEEEKEEEAAAAAEEEEDGKGKGDGDAGVLATGGSFLVKVLEGGDTRAFADELRPRFEAFKWARPPATRARSTEVYLLGLGRK